MLTPSIGVCDHAVDRLRLRDVRRFEHGRRDVDDVLELAADLALGLDARRPADDQRVARAAEVGGHLLGPHERRVAGHRPARRHVREGLGAAPLVDVLEHVGHGLGDAVEVGHLVEHAEHAALGAGAVVADLVDDQRVVELAQVLDGLHDAADLVVGVRGERGEHFHLPREQPLLVGAERVPGLDVGGPVGQLGVLRDDAQLLLPGEGLLAVLVPAAVELALELRDPLLRHVMRRVRGAGGEVGEERLVRGQRLLAADPLDGLVGHVGREVVVRVVRRLHLDGAVEDQRRPLVGLAADEAVELVEAGVASASDRTGRRR